MIFNNIISSDPQRGSSFLASSLILLPFYLFAFFSLLLLHVCVCVYYNQCTETGEQLLGVGSLLALWVQSSLLTPWHSSCVEWSGHWSKAGRIQGHARSTVGIEGEDADSFP